MKTKTTKTTNTNEIQTIDGGDFYGLSFLLLFQWFVFRVRRALKPCYPHQRLLNHRNVNHDRAGDAD